LNATISAKRKMNAPARTKINPNLIFLVVTLRIKRANEKAYSCPRATGSHYPKQAPGWEGRLAPASVVSIQTSEGKPPFPTL
jgi:hypothetical protein